MSTGGWARRAGVAGAAIGAVAAGVAVERLTVHRGVRRKARLALDAVGPYGTLRGMPGTAVAEDGTELYYEIDEPGPADASTGEDLPGVGGARGTGGPTVPAIGPRQLGLDQAPRAARPSRRRLFGGRSARRRGAAEPQVPTVVFSHGYCLGQDVWHFQRAALRGTVRTVFWDQRSHGRSERGRAQRESGDPVSMEQLGRDLRAVLDAAVPHGPIVLVGHSMGGMTMMALADQYPDFVAERVVGTAFIGTSAGGLSEVTYGLPAVGAKALNRFAPGLLKALGARPAAVERGRRATADLFAGLIRRYAFGSSDVDPAVARFAERLIESVPIDVVAEFYPAFDKHDKTAALAAFDNERPALVLTGERDQITPLEHSAAIAEALPGAELVRIPGAGHLVVLEYPESVNEHLAQLLARTIRSHGRTIPPPRTADRAERRTDRGGHG